MQLSIWKHCIQFELKYILLKCIISISTPFQRILKSYFKRIAGDILTMLYATLRFAKTSTFPII